MLHRPVCFVMAVALALLAGGSQTTFADGSLAETYVTGAQDAEKEGGQANPFDFLSREPHQLRIIDEGVAALEMRLQMIGQARHSIELETMIFDPDQSGRLIAQTLVAKKRSNPALRVRLLVDALPLGRELTAYHARELEKRGIEVRFYNHAGFRDAGQAIRRDHRKVLIIDDEEALTGGRNIADNYFDLKKGANFIDRDLWIRGSGVQRMREVFDCFWQCPLSQRSSLPAAEPLLPFEGHKTLVAAAKDFLATHDADRTLRAAVQRIGSKQLDAIETHESRSTTFISDRPGWGDPKDRVTSTALFAMIAQSNREVLFENAYIVLGDLEKAIISDRLTHHVSIVWLTNSGKATSESIANLLTLSSVGEAARKGVRVYLYQGQSPPGTSLPWPLRQYGRNAAWGTHAKTLVTDGKNTLIGSVNADPLSTWGVNAETAVIVHDNPAFARAVSNRIWTRINCGSQIVRGPGHDAEFSR